MSGNKILLDTNAVLYLLGGKLSPRQIPKGFYVISFVSELELLSYPNLTEIDEKSIKKFLTDVEIIDVTPEIKRQTITMRKQYNLKLPDAIICATALSSNALLVTFDKSLRKVTEVNILIPS
ncbi:MAG: type II toxin-antitoxin system VapC family toxin [Ignavibacteriae bacterium]|nr:type II toxin-antitoxin system VapC family toxin [Ignavibacteriota bacterium]